MQYNKKGTKIMKREESRIRDPFVLVVGGIYYLYGSTDAHTWHGPGTGFDVYTSRDLEYFEGPYPVFRPDENFWGKENFWAPEVYHYQGKFFMFASFKAEGKSRGTQVLKADSPLGPFVPIGNQPLTPENWECLDGTLYIDENKNPYMVFCHEWTQISDGEICVVALSDDLSEAIGEPVKLFAASDAEWTREVKREGHVKKCYVTDGPFIYKNRKGELVMMWSSFGENGYTMGQSLSKNGIYGPWEHVKKPVFSKDGGHGMMFWNIPGDLMLTIHNPNKTGEERPIFLRVGEMDGLLGTL